jgi:hypothetical protein
LEAGQFAEVNPAPESPGELHAENLRHAGAPSNGGEQVKDLELERLRGLAATTFFASVAACRIACCAVGG